MTERIARGKRNSEYKGKIMREPLVLTIDFGTQSVRAMLFDKYGKEYGKVKVHFKEPYFSKDIGWAEQTPEFYWDRLKEATNGLKEQCADLWDDVKGVAVTTIRDTAVIVDKDGKPLRDIILWLDQREVKDADKTRFGKGFKSLLRMLNLYDLAAAQCKASACNWVHEYEPEVWAKMYKFLMFSGWITFRLTGVMKDSVANQIGHIPFDYKNKTWQSSKAITAPIFDLKAKDMCELIEPGTIVGYITKEASRDLGIKEGIPVVASGSDKGCETLGSGCVDSTGASLSLGTTATVQMTTDKYIETEPFVPTYPAVLPGKYNPEIEIYRGYWMISWFKNEFAHKEVKEAKELGISAEELLNRHLKDVPAGCEGLILQPYWTPGIKHPTARGAILGFADCHTRIHIYRAIIEGIAYGLYDGLLSIQRKTKIKVKFISVSGGGSESDEICQITSNIMGIPVRRAQTYETSSLGAAITAFTGLGVYESFEEAAKNMVHVSAEFKPDMKEHELYNKLYSRIYRRIYPNNKRLYDDLKQILRSVKAEGNE